ncbi:uncharacterized protein [Patagioenas fasciata]|uniref:uncharacterized protein n=1 Tax=Patagioenas fasciata TaxID=372321 RepID=UPI003A9A20ED
MEEGGEGLLQDPAPPPSPGTGSAEREGWGAAEDLGLLCFSVGKEGAGWRRGREVGNELGEEKNQEESERKKPPGWVTICTLPLSKKKKKKGERKKPNSGGNQRCSDCKRQPSCRGYGGENSPAGPAEGQRCPGPGRPGSPRRAPLRRQRLLLSSSPLSVSPSSLLSRCRRSSLAASPGSSSLPPAAEAKPKTSWERPATSRILLPCAAASAEYARRRRAAPAEGSAAGRCLPGPGAAGRRALLGTPSLSENLIYKKSLTMVGNLFVFNKNLKFWVHMRHALLPFILVEQTLSISAWDVHQNSPQGEDYEQHCFELCISCSPR